jgi:succinyl-CoA synthetase beta subunit
MVKLYEYQGKKLLKDARILIPEGEVASTPEEAEKIATRIGKPVVVKAQVWTTGRSKAGGIKFANTPEEAKSAAKELFNTTIKGLDIKKILVEEKLAIAQELFVSIIVNDSYKIRGPTLILSSAGGIDIEEVAEKTPEKIVRFNVDILQGLRSYEILDMALDLEIPSSLLRPIGQTVLQTYDVFRRYNARTVEINPLIVTSDGKLYAADCRVTIDDSSVIRHPELGINLPRDMERPATPLEEIAWTIEANDYRGTAYFAQIASESELEQGGLVGFHGIGGGGTMKGADALARHGLKIANYTDTSGNPPASKLYRIAKVILAQRGIEGYAFIGATLASQNQYYHALGLLRAFKEDLENKPGFPIVILLAGNKEAESLEILQEGLNELPVQFELYGREKLRDLDFVAKRMKSLVEKYRASKAAGG